MGVGQVVHNLPDRPSVGAIGRIELAVGQPFEGVAEPTWKLGDFQENPAAVCIGNLLTGKPSNRITQIYGRHGSKSRWTTPTAEKWIANFTDKS